eukprot:c22019_g2_i2.p1 GENE.c22019_g2_i2~~c22019_g2_i2.p1  ORF type:complete len:529 (+),score=177.00 c22019_g2_i2:24-1589(+)
MNIKNLDIPTLESYYPRHRGWPIGISVSDAKVFLSIIDGHARCMWGHEFELLDDSFELTPNMFLKRFGSFSPDRKDWLDNAGLGSVDEKFLNSFSTAYDSSILHSFSNCPDFKQIFFQGETVVSVGFCDFGLLLNCELKDNDSGNNGPLKFVGVDQSPFTIAKSLVIYEMLKGKQSNESILEVWFSSTWSEGTWKDFKDAVSVIEKQEGEVGEYLSHWLKSSPFPLDQARNEWLKSMKRSSCGLIFGFKRMNDILDTTEYVLSGDLIMRQGKKSVCGNSTMFDHPILKYKRAHNEKIFETIYLPDLIKSMKETSCLFDAIRNMKLKGIKKVRKWISQNLLQIELIHGSLCLQNKNLIQRLKNMKPSAVGWSNCSDFMSPKDFHKLARSIGSDDCVHFGYSLNWVIYVFGTSIIDYRPAQVRKELLDLSKSAIELLWNSLGATEYLLSPPITNPINHAHCSLCMNYKENWLKYFFKSSTVGGPVNHPDAATHMNVYSPFERVHGQLNFTWTYDMKLNLHPKK